MKGVFLKGKARIPVSWDTKDLAAAWMRAGSQMPVCVPGAGWVMCWAQGLLRKLMVDRPFSGKARFSEPRACV